MNAPIVARPHTLASLLQGRGSDPAARTDLWRLLRQGLLALTVACALLGAWAAVAPISGAVIAPAQIKVELNRKTVQHQEGGIVREIKVREGQRVAAGEVLLVIGDVRSDAELSLQQDLLQAALARKARSEAEAALAPQFTAANADAGAAEHIARERALFVARRRTLDEQVTSLQSQIQQANAQASALQARIDATEASARLSDEELQVNDQLVQQGFLNRTRLLSLQRTSADYRARVAEYRGELAAVRQRIGELQARIAQSRNQYQNQATDELKEAATRVRELEQRLRPSRDQVERQLVRSPVDGVAMTVRVSAVGEAIGPRDPLIDVVPENEKLVFEARIRPEDIEHVHPSTDAEVRLTGLDAATIRPLPGRVTFVSPDRVSKPDSREAWYVATIEVDADVVRTRPELRLLPGMPAEVFVTTGARTLLQYLAKPLSVFSSRALREP